MRLGAGEEGGEDGLLVGGVLMPMGWTLRLTSNWIPWYWGYEPLRHGWGGWCVWSTGVWDDSGGMKALSLR